MSIVQRLWYYVLQVRGLLVFRKRVYVHGWFKVGNARNISIGNRCSINEGVYLLGRCRIDIGNEVTLSARCMLIDSGLQLGVEQREHIDGPIAVEDGAWIGAGAIVLPNVRIGRKSVVGAGSVVTRDVPPYAIVAGNPARVIRNLKAE